jgi:DNA polymerase III subunit epsilon
MRPVPPLIGLRAGYARYQKWCDRGWRVSPQHPNQPLTKAPGAKLLNAIDKNAAILWAREVISNPSKYYILDTATTGLDHPEVIELAIIDIHGSMVINQRFKPKASIEAAATKIHGITNEMLVNCPEWNVIANRMENIVNNRTLLIYNEQFDRQAICNSYTAQYLNYPGMKSECVMQWYSQFIGECTDYRGHYRSQKLPSRDHSAIGDCLATLEVIKAMADTELETQLTDHLTASQVAEDNWARAS